MACTVTDLATDFLGKGTEQNRGKNLINWNERNGEYRVLKGKRIATEKAIDELTLLSRKYGVKNPGPMFTVETREYNFKGAETETSLYLKKTGKGAFQVLVENEAFISEFQQKYEAYQRRIEQEESSKRNNEQLKLEFDEQTRKLESTTNKVFESSPDFFYIGTKKDYIDFLRENGRENDSDYLESNEAFEDFRKFVEDRFTDNLYANREYTNTRNKGDTISEETRRNQAAISKYIDKRRELLQSTKNNMSNFIKLNKGRENEDSYIQNIKEFHEVIDTMTEEISNLTTTDAKVVFADIISEIEMLDKSLDSIDMFKTENHEILSRFELLSELILGREASGLTKDREGLIVFDGEGIEGYYENVHKPMDKLQEKYNAFLYQVAKDAFENDPIFVENKEKFDEEELDYVYKSLKTSELNDINPFSKYALGINSNDDSVITKVLNDLFQMHVRKVEQTVLDREYRLAELEAKLRKAKFDTNKFYGKDANGVLTGKLISKFSSAWYSAISGMMDLRRDFDSSNRKLKQSKYNVLMNWHEKNSSFIDVRRLREFKDDYSDEFGDHFTFSDTEMSEYEAELREILGRKYEEVISQQRDAIENFFKYEDAQLNIASKWTNKNIIGANPFLFLDNYYSENRRKALPATVEGMEDNVFNAGRYNSFIPIRETVDSFGNISDTGYYDQTFERNFENNDDAYEAQKIMESLLTEHINPAYSLEGRNIAALQIPMLRQQFSESFVKARADGLTAVVKASAHSLIGRQKDKWFDANYVTDKKGITANYSDSATRDVRNFKNALKLVTNEDLLIRARELGLTFPEGSARDFIIDGIARAEVLPAYSTDIFQNITAVSSKASMQIARKNTTFIAELLYRQFISGTGAERRNSIGKFRDWIDTQIYGKRNKKKSEENNFIAKKGIKRLTDADKKLRDLFKEVSKGEIGEGVNFYRGDTHYFQAADKNTKQLKYFKVEKLKVEEGVTDPLEVDPIPEQVSKEEFKSMLDEYLDERISQLGINMTFSSFVSGTLRNLSVGFLGFNPKAGLKNRVEGILANSAADAQGILWETGSDRYSVKILNGANLFRLANGKLDFAARKKAEQLRSIDMLVKRLGVLQDRRDFRDKKNQVSRYDRNKDLFDVYNFAVGIPEYQNQITVMLNVLQGYRIKDYRGNDIGFVNGDGIIREGGKEDGKIIDTMSYLPAYEPGTLKLKPEYKYTAEAFDENGILRKDINLNNYINKDNIAFETFQVFDVNNGVAEGSNAIHMLNLKVQDAINKTQGNYSAMDSQVIMGNNWGRMLMSFKRHTPEHINQRFGTFGTDIIQGRAKYEGRYRPIFRNPGAASVLLSTLAMVSMGPQIAAFVAGAGILHWGANQVYNKWYKGQDILDLSDNLLSAAGTLQEVLIRTANLPLAITRSKWQLEDTKVWKHNWAFEKLRSRESLTKEEIGAIKASAQELVVQIGVLLSMILAKSVYSSDEDDEEAKQTRNFIDNYGNQIMGSISTWTDPLAAWEDGTSILLLAPLQNIARFVHAVKKYQRNKASGTEVIVAAMRAQPLVPVFTLPIKAIKEGGIDRMWKDEREYMSGQWHDELVFSKEQKLRISTEDLRAGLKNEYVKHLTPMYIEQYGYDRRKATQAAEALAAKINNTADIGTRRKPGETWEELNKRIDADELKKNTKATVEKYLRKKGHSKKLPEFQTKLEKKQNKKRTKKKG